MISHKDHRANKDRTRQIWEELHLREIGIFFTRRKRLQKKASAHETWEQKQKGCICTFVWCSLKILLKIKVTPKESLQEYLTQHQMTNRGKV